MQTRKASLKYNDTNKRSPKLSRKLFWFLLVAGETKKSGIIYYLPTYTYTYIIYYHLLQCDNFFTMCHRYYKVRQNKQWLRPTAFQILAFKLISSTEKTSLQDISLVPQHALQFAYMIKRLYNYNHDKKFQLHTKMFSNFRSPCTTPFA